MPSDIEGVDGAGSPDVAGDPVRIETGDNSVTVFARAGVKPAGEVPFDNETLPLISPNGRYIATQTGVPPTWPTSLAQPDATIPEATRIETYRLDLRGDAPERLAEVVEAAVLGRSCDDEGFLVEWPREDGSRWIGKAAWSTGEVRWLIRGTDVNAFGVLGPDGRLAFSSRTQDQTTFDLAVSTPEDNWMIVSRGESWLMPVFSADGQTLYAMRLDPEGKLELASMLARSAAAMRQSLQTTLLTNRGTPRIAYQSLAPQAASIGAAPPGSRGLLFYHPAHNAIALWSPGEWIDDRPIILTEGSYSAAFDQGTFALLATPGQLVRQNTRDTKAMATLLRGTLIPRSVRGTQWSHVLMAPTNRGTIALTAMRLLPG